MPRNLGELALSVDRASDHTDVDALRRAVEECTDELTSADSKQRVSIHYFQAKAYKELYSISCRQDEAYRWGWEQEEANAGILALRCAIGGPALRKENLVRRCQIRANLANALSHVGRPVEAIEQWDNRSRRPSAICHCTWQSAKRPRTLRPEPLRPRSCQNSAGGGARGLPPGSGARRLLGQRLPRGRCRSLRGIIGTTGSDQNKI